jgi:alpha-ribazole phosphatase
MKNYRLSLIRHGITQGNLDGVYIGGGTDQPLCTEGRQQLQQLAARFVYPKVGTVFASPMVRALETADLLFPDAKNKIILEDLRESAFGEFEGRRIADLTQDENFKKWMDPTQRYVPVGGEAPADFHKRCSKALMGMLEYMMKTGTEQAACVTHGGVIMSMLAQRGMPKYPPEHWMADSGCGFLVQCSPQMWMRDGVVEICDIVPFGYLDDQPDTP